MTATTPSEELMLALVRDAADLGPVPAGIADDGLVEALERQRLLPLLGTRLCRRMGENAPARFCGYVDERLEASRQVGLVQETLAHAVLEELAGRGIRACPLKGPNLARRIHGDVGLRDSTDIDVLVASDDLEAAVAAVVKMGWRDTAVWRDRQGRPLLHLALDHPKHLPPVEIHWRVHWYEERSAAAALRRSTFEAGTWALADRDLLAFLLLFHARDGLAGLRLVADVVALLRQAPDARDGVRATAEAAPELERALVTAAAAIEQVVPGSFSELGGDDRVGPSAMALKVSDPMLRASLQQRRANQALVDILLTPPRGHARAIRRNVFPPWAVLRQQQPALAAARAPRLVAASAEHCARSLRRLGIALRCGVSGRLS
jgi:hypothetical protein